MIKIDRKWLRKALRDIAEFGQIGFTIVVPPVLLCLAASFIQKHFYAASWIYAPAIIIGLLCSFRSIYRLCRIYMLKNTKKDANDEIIYYTKHE